MRLLYLSKLSNLLEIVHDKIIGNVYENMGLPRTKFQSRVYQ